MRASHLIVSIVMQRWATGNAQGGSADARRGPARNDQSSRRCFLVTVARELVKSASRDFLPLHNVLSCPKEVPLVLNELEETSDGGGTHLNKVIYLGRRVPSDIYFFGYIP